MKEDSERCGADRTAPFANIGKTRTGFTSLARVERIIRELSEEEGAGYFLRGRGFVPQSAQRMADQAAVVAVFKAAPSRARIRVQVPAWLGKAEAPA